MANEQIKKSYKDIADAIRSKTGKNGLMTAEEMPAEIEGIETGINPTGTLTINTNGVADVTAYASVDVNVPNPSTGTLEITENGITDVTAYASVDVNVPSYPEPEGTEYIENNGEFNIKDYEYVNVNVPNPLEGVGEGLFYWYDSSGSLYPMDLSESRYWFYNGGTNFTALDLEDMALYYGGGSTGEGFTKIELEAGKTYLYSGEGNFQEVE